MNYFKRWRTPNQGSFIHTWAANENPIAHFRKFTFIFSSTDKNSTCHLLSTPEAQQSSQRVGCVLVLPSRVLHCCIEYTATAYQVRKLIKSRNRIRPSIVLLILQINPKGRCSHPHLTTGKWRLSVTKQHGQGHPTCKWRSLNLNPGSRYFPTLPGTGSKHIRAGRSLKAHTAQPHVYCLGIAPSPWRAS